MITHSWREKKPDIWQTVCENSPAPSGGFYKHPSFLNQTSTRPEKLSDASGVWLPHQKYEELIESNVKCQQWQKQTNKQT